MAGIQKRTDGDCKLQAFGKAAVLYGCACSMSKKSETRSTPDFIKLVETNPNFQMFKIQNRFEHSNL
jgi:hypothetical protein